MSSDPNLSGNLYADIIDLPRPVSAKHPPMPMADRAAQFAPFAALSGHDDMIGERLHEHTMQIEFGDQYWDLD